MIATEGKISVVLTIDTEPDDAWTNHLNPSVANVQELLRLQQLLDRYGAKATCLVTYRVIEDDRAVDVLRRLVEEQGAEIGAHLHPWETPPYTREGWDVRYAVYPHELPLSLFEAKLSSLGAAITERIGRPRSYRAGRWGLAAEHLAVLERLGYEVDTSVTPLMDWRSKLGLPRSENGYGGPDYRFAPKHPYHPDYARVIRKGSAQILEIPVTGTFTRATPSFVGRAYGLLPALGRRLLRKCGVLRPVWAMPAWESRGDLLRMIRVALEEGAPVVNIAMHSSELMVTGSPRSGTRAEVDEIFNRIEAVLQMLSAEGVCEFSTVCAAAKHWTARHESESNGLCDASSVRAFGLPPAGASAPQPRVRDLAYILSPSYSGSTLLTFLLNAHADVATIGELKATAMGDVDQYLCSCGARLRECLFWKRVTQEMSDRGLPFDVEHFGTHFRFGSHPIANRLLRARVGGIAFEKVRALSLRRLPGASIALRRIIETNSTLIEVVVKLQRGTIFLDASKDPVRLKYLLGAGYRKTRVIYLIRDGRGVANSYRRSHRISMEASAREWCRADEECERTISQLPVGSWLTIHYEDLCRDPDPTLSRTFRFLGLDPDRATRDFRSAEHHILGNYMRLKSTSEIVLDEKWKSALTPGDLATFERIAGERNRRYGYS